MSSVFDSAVVVQLFDYLGTFAFALNGSMAATRLVRLDIVGVVTLGFITACGGGIVRDVLLGATPPAVFGDWMYAAAALAGALIAFFLTRPHRFLESTVQVLDAVGLSLFCVVGAQKALLYDVAPIPAVLLGIITAAGGGIIRDMMLGRVPTVLTSELYAIPAMAGATVVVLTSLWGPVNSYLWSSTLLFGAILCFAIRLLGIRFNLHAPASRARPPEASETNA